MNVRKNKNDYNSLRRRLSPELFSEIMNVNKTSNRVNESSLNRIRQHIENNQCAVITAFRSNLTNCATSPDDERKLNLYSNKGRNKKLLSSLLFLGYGVTEVKGTYIENYMEENAVEVKEDSFFVVNIKDDNSFIDNIVRLGELFCQDSVMIFDFGDNYLYGTNNSQFPGLGNKISLGKFRPAIEGEFMTKISKRPFTVENYDSLQINTKRLVKECAIPIINIIKS